jgi:DNA-binding transcriptional LysR family regulator
MDIAHLKTFLEIYQTRHFGKSAEKLCITQSAASARIKLLEERLGVKLFTRDRHAIEPTPAGHRFHKYAEMTVSGWERARQMVALPEEYTQSLSLGYLPDTWHLFLKGWVDKIREEMPETALNLTIHPGHNVQELILSGSLDIGFVFDPINSGVLQSVNIASLKLKLFANHPDTPLEDAMGKGYVMVDWGALFEHEHSRAFTGFPAASIRTNYGVMALDLLRIKRRAAYLPEQIITNNVAQIPLYEVAGAPVFERNLFAVYRTDNNSQALIDKFMQVITEN